jgi:hypothetical protein
MTRSQRTKENEGILRRGDDQEFRGNVMRDACHFFNVESHRLAGRICLVRIQTDE